MKDEVLAPSHGRDACCVHLWACSSGARLPQSTPHATASDCSSKAMPSIVLSGTRPKFAGHCAAAGAPSCLPRESQVPGTAMTVSTFQLPLLPLPFSARSPARESRFQAETPAASAAHFSLGVPLGCSSPAELAAATAAAT